MARQNRAQRQARLTTPKAKEAELAALSRDDLYKRAQAADLTGLSKATKDELIKALLSAPEASGNGSEPVASKRAERERRGEEAAARYEANRENPDAPQADQNSAIRGRLASDELKQLIAWEDGGREGEQPATPNYDALSAHHRNGVTLPTASTSKRAVKAAARRGGPKEPRVKRPPKEKAMFVVYSQTGRFEGRTVDAELAAAMVSVLGDGSTVAYNRAVVWTEGPDGDGTAGDSYDKSADTMRERIAEDGGE